MKSAALRTGTIITLLSAIFLSGCFHKEHLTFHDIPMTGSLESFAGELTRKGFTLVDSTDSQERILDGDFLGKHCRVRVLGGENNQMISKVVVSRPKEIHDSLQADFSRIQKIFALRYGPGKSIMQQYKKRERLVYKMAAREVRDGDLIRHSTDSGEITIEVIDGTISITFLNKP